MVDPGPGNDGSSACLDALFRLPPAIQVPGDHRAIELLADAGRYTEAARAIGRMRFASLIDRNRAALARAACLMNAGRPELAIEALGPARRTMAGAWYRACGLVRLGRLEEASAEVMWVGERVPLLDGDRSAAQALFGVLGLPLPTWLVDPRDEPQPRPATGRDAPPPYLASFFHPPRPEVPEGLEDVAKAIQLGRYAEAARRLIAHPTAVPRCSRQVAVAAAECWLLADEPGAAEAWLQHRLTARGVWALACVRVQTNRLQAALEPLVWLARRGALDDDRRDAAAALVAHLGLESPPPGLAELGGHPYLTLSRAQEAGYLRFAEDVVRRIERQRTAAGAQAVVQDAVASSANLPEDEALKVLVPAYEAAVRAFPCRAEAEHGLRLLMSRPDLLGADAPEYSRALLFATACDRLDDLHRALHQLAGRTAERSERFACWLALAKLSLVHGNGESVISHAGRAIALADSVQDSRRARRLRRAARWLTPGEAIRISTWRLRQLHHLLPLQVAERLEERHRADAGLRDAAAIAKDRAQRLPELRAALGRWALDTGLALLDAGVPGTYDAVPFTGAAWGLLGPAPPPAVREAHARALGLACAAIGTADGVAASLDAGMRAMPDIDGVEPGFREEVLHAWREARRVRGGPPASQAPDLVRLLRPVSTLRPRPLGYRRVVLRDLRGISPDALQVVDDCIADRFALLPDAPPFRGRCWFDSDTAQRLYQLGREETDPRAPHKAFEDAWMREPTNRVTIQGLILGLSRRLSEKASRNHLLEHLARILDQLANREVEAALAYATLADLAGADRERRSCLARAAAALHRRVERKPWIRARNAEIAIHLELGNLVAAGQAAWEESCLWLPGSEVSSRYAMLAATLWRRSEDGKHSQRDRVREAELRSRSPRLTNREAVRHAVTTGRLMMLSDLVLDDNALEDLWRACRGDEDDLCRFLEKQGSRQVDPRPHYLEFLLEKLNERDPPAAARIRNCFGRGGAVPASTDMAWLRLAAAELVAGDPLLEVATHRYRLCEVPMRHFLARLRDAARDDRVAYHTFHTAVEDALAALFDLRQAAPATEPEQQGGRFMTASEALATVRRAARRFGNPALVHIADLLFRYLALGLDTATAEAYMREKDKRLVPSRLGVRLGEWWASLCDTTAPLDFFHHHQSYLLPEGVPLADWWRTHEVHGMRVLDAARRLLHQLEGHTRRLNNIEASYLRSRSSRDLGGKGFGMSHELATCCRALRAAVEPGAPAGAVRAVGHALERLGVSLRRIDLARLVDLVGVLYDNRLPPDRYLLPRAPELLHHWRGNVLGGRCLEVILEVRDDAGRDVLCLMCLDEGARPAPESTPLRGLAGLADLVDALGGQLHLWMARPGERSGCRREHRTGLTCAADEYVVRIEDRLRRVMTERWHAQRQAVEPWLAVLDQALYSQGSATLAFAILPRLR